MAEMIRSVSDALVGEEFKDTTGLAEREEVNMDLGLFGMGFNLKKYLGIKR